MGATRGSSPARTQPVRWLSCRLRRGNPLRRGSDRVEGCCALLAVLLLAVAVPASILLGLRVAGERAQAAERARADRVHTSAVLLADAPAAAGIDAAHRAAGKVPVRARWSHGDDTRTGTVDVSPGLDRGDHVSIWLDARGHPVPAPPTASQVTMSSAGTGLGLLFATVAAVAAGWLAVRLLLDHARSVAWEREWRGINRLPSR